MKYRKNYDPSSVYRMGPSAIATIDHYSNGKRYTFELPKAKKEYYGISEFQLFTSKDGKYIRHIPSVPYNGLGGHGNVRVVRYSPRMGQYTVGYYTGGPQINWVTIATYTE